MNDLISRFNDNSLYRAMGIEITAIDRVGSQARLIPNPDLCWPFEGQPHGGVLFTLIDTAMAVAVIGAKGLDCSSATISLNIQYTARAKEAPFLCSTRVMHSTKNMCFVEGKIADATEQVVAMAHGTFKIVHLG